jgi:hypothetical protein
MNMTTIAQSHKTDETTSEQCLVCAKKGALNQHRSHSPDQGAHRTAIGQRPKRGAAQVAASVRQERIIVAQVGRLVGSSTRRSRIVQIVFIGDFVVLAVSFSVFWLLSCKLGRFF